jgi:hypothetical protein
MGRARFRAGTAVAAAVLLALLPLGSGPANAERVQSKNLIVAFGGGISPLALPRDRPAPVAVNFDGRILTADGLPLPRLDRIRIALASRGVVFTRGLPICPLRELQASDTAHALRACGPALVGRGKLEAKIYFPGQGPSDVRADLLAFNGRTVSGRAAIWILVYPYDPALPASFVLPFVMHRVPAGANRVPQTILTAAMPSTIRRWPRLARFHFTFFRRYSYRGVRRSYLSASCPAPAGFTAGFLAFAQVSYRFGDGRILRTEAVRSCRAR